jgi:hypothetical protein
MSKILPQIFGNVAIQPMATPVDRSLAMATSLNHSMLHSQPFTMMGIVTAVYPPSSPENRSKNQYEYQVKAVGIQKSHTTLHCVVNDRFGGNNDYERYTLRLNQRVLVSCLVGNPNEGVIIGGIKNRLEKDSVDLGHHWIRRFNQITESITKDNVHYIKHDSGNEISIEPNKIIIKDGSGQEILVDKKNKKITITNGSDVITIDKNKNTIQMNAKDLKVDLKGNLNMNVSGTANIKAKNINFNGGKAGIVTGGPNGSHPVDFVTGAPIKTVRNIKAG